MSHQFPAPGDKSEPKDPVREDFERGCRLLGEEDWAGAAQALHNALLGFEEAENEEGAANASDKLGDLCLARRDFARAIDHYERAFAICKKHDDLFSLNSLRKKLARCFRGLGRYDEALRIYMTLLDLYESMHNPSSAVETLIAAAETFQEQGEKAKAADAYRTAAAIHESFKHEQHARELLDKAEALEA